MNVTDYARRPESERELIRSGLREAATRARRTYARMVAAEAGIATRHRLPNAARLAFTVTDTPHGVSVGLVEVCNARGRRLWHIDHNPEWPDESVVTDRLATAWQWCTELFTPVPGHTRLRTLDLARHPTPERTGRMPMIRKLLDLSTAHLPEDLGRESLDAAAGVIAYRLDHGWLMWVPPDLDDYQIDHDMPPVILTICRYSRGQGCDYVLFDADADTVDELPTWEWT